MKLPFEVISIWEWLWEKIHGVELEVNFSHPLKVADIKLKQVLDTRATDLACYCNGCFFCNP